MVSVTKNPTTNVNVSAWQNPTNAYLEDGNCASKNSVNIAVKLLTLGGYGFALPLNAILDNIFLNHKGIISEPTIGSGLTFNWVTNNGNFTLTDNNSDSIFGANCGTCSWAPSGEHDVLPLLKSNGFAPTINDINNETNWIAQVAGTPQAASARIFYIDVVQIRIVYHVPVAAGEKAFLGDGFYFVF